MTIFSKNDTDTFRAGSDLAKKLGRGSVVALYGDLGAGKTCFVRGLAAGLGLSVRVSSPTFTIVNEYLGEIPLFHFDMYRLKNEDELFEIGWDDYLERGGIIAVEWSENVPHAFPENTVRVAIQTVSDTERRIEISFPEGKTDSETPECRGA